MTWDKYVCQPPRANEFNAKMYSKPPTHRFSVDDTTTITY